MKGTHGMGIDESGDQELSSRQMQPVEVASVTDSLQERIGGRGRCRREDVIYRLDDTIMADVDARARDGLVGALVDGREESAGYKESHMTDWNEFKCGRKRRSGCGNDGGRLGATAGLGNWREFMRGQKTLMEVDGRVPSLGGDCMC